MIDAIEEIKKRNPKTLSAVAASHKARALALVLTGTGTDGAMGVRAIKKMGGTVVVQNPEHAEFSGMPQAAIDTQVVDFIVPLDDIPEALLFLVGPARSHESSHDGLEHNAGRS